MEKLLRQEELYFYPIEGEFDIAEAEKVISGLGYYWQCPLVPNLFLIFEDQQSRAKTDERHKLNPNERLPYVLLIQISEEEILINQFAGSDFDVYSRVFISWILKNYKCTVNNEMGTDLTNYLPKINDL